MQFRVPHLGYSRLQGSDPPTHGGSFSIDSEVLGSRLRVRHVQDKCPPQSRILLGEAVPNIPQEAGVSGQRSQWLGPAGVPEAGWSSPQSPHEFRLHALSGA